MFDRRLTREWMHGIAALFLGLFLLGISPNLGVLKSAVDLVGGVLSFPEYPAVVLRRFLSDVYLWSHDKNLLKRQLELLQEENARLRITHSVLVAEQIKAELNTRLETARVTLREPSPSSWWSEIRIDKGMNDHVVVGLPVFQDGFLVGRVTSASAFSSWVELLTSPSLMVPVVVEETRELGVVVGDGNGSIQLTYLPEGRGIERGMKVSTALVSEILPPGIPIGEIADEGTVSANGYVTYRIKPGASLSRLYTVSILKRSRGIL